MDEGAHADNELNHNPAHHTMSLSVKRPREEAGEEAREGDAQIPVTRGEPADPLIQHEDSCREQPALYHEKRYRRQQLESRLEHTNNTHQQYEQPPAVSSAPNPLLYLSNVGNALKTMEELKLLQEVVGTDPEGVRKSLQLNGVDRVYSTEELVAMIQELMAKVMPGLVQDLDLLLAAVATRYGTVQLKLPPSVPGSIANPSTCLNGGKSVVKAKEPGLLGMSMGPAGKIPDPVLPEPTVPAVPELSRESMISMYGTPMAVVEKKMSNREYMSRFRLNTRFASELLPAYDHTNATPTIYGALERLLLANITVCTVDGRAYQVVYELARTVKNDWLHHRFTTGWAEVVKELGIEIGDLLVFERWTEDRTILTMHIIKERQLAKENPDYAWSMKPLTAAQRKGQF